MGTPEFAVKPLVALIEHNVSVIGVVTAPDKPAGRGKKIQKSAVKICAEQYNIPILQPEYLKSEHFVEAVRELNPDLILVVAFRMLPKVIWSIPPMGTCNLHASLLPHYRGAAPINWAIVHGETQTGVTTFFINEQIDTGHIIAQKKVPISYTQTAGELYEELMSVGAELLVETVTMIEQNTVKAIPQSSVVLDESLKTAPKISKETCKIQFMQNAVQIYNHIRGFSPYPAAWFLLSNNKESYICKVFFAEYKEEQHKYNPGTIIQEKDSLCIACADGFIFPTQVQLQGKKRMSIEECLRGFLFSNFVISM